MKLRDVMTRNVEVLSPHETLAVAAERMRRENISTMAVCHGRRLLGVLTDRDLVVRGMALHLDPETTPVERCMSEDVLWCRDEDDVGEVARVMAEKQAHRVLVLDNERDLVGVVSPQDFRNGN